MDNPSELENPEKKEEEAAASNDATPIKAEEEPKKEERASPVTRSKTRTTPVEDEEVQVVEPSEKIIKGRRKRAMTMKQRREGAAKRNVDERVKISTARSIILIATLQLLLFQG